MYECLGPQAVDSDGIEFTGWRIERLFHLNDKHAAVIARSASIRQRMAVEPAAAARGVEPNLDGLEALTSVIDFCAVQPDEHWTQDAVAALVLASACDGELREGFLSLWAFIREHRVKLDIGRQANILMDCFGRLRLADPVTMRLEADGGGLAASPAWLATQLPVRQRGFRVAMTWVATPFRSSASAAAAQRLLKARAPSLESHLCDEQAAVSYLRRETVDEAFRFGSSLSELMSPTLRSSLLQQAELH